MERILKKADIVLIALLLLSAVVAVPLFSNNGDQGGAVTIRVGGVVDQVLPLSVDREVTIAQTDGRQVNTLAVSGGQVRMIYADCPDGLCLKHKPARLTGEMIVCLPNRVVAEVTGGPDGFDAVVQ